MGRFIVTAIYYFSLSKGSEPCKCLKQEYMTLCLGMDKAFGSRYCTLACVRHWHVRLDLETSPCSVITAWTLLALWC